MAQQTKSPYSSKRSATPAARKMLASGGYAQGGAISGVGRSNKAHDIEGRKQPRRLARGGRSGKHTTVIHIHAGRPPMPSMPGAPAMPMGAPPAMPHPPMGAPPMPPMGGAPMMPPGAGPVPGAPPPGMPPMPMRARGGACYDLGGSTAQAAAGAGAQAASLNNSSLNSDRARLVSELSRYGTHVP